jgi:flagellar motor switch protein FliN/FliY
MTQTVQAPAGIQTEPGVDLTDGIQAAAAAVAGLLPAGQAVRPGPALPAGQVTAADWAAAAVAPLQRGELVGLLVRAELADALAGAAGGGLDVADAVQPALDAAAAALGASAGAGRTVVGAELAETLAAATVAVPLQAGGETAAVLFVVAGAGTVAERPGQAAGSAPVRGVELLHGVAMEVTVELGRTRLSVRELLALSPGDVLELDRAAGSPADLLVNGRLIARGEVVVVDEDFALRVTEIVAGSAGG